MSPTEREQRLKFLKFSEQDCQLLKALRLLFEQNVSAIEDAFYEHLLGFPETAQLLKDHTTVERLKKLQRDYLLRITEGKFDDAYLEDRFRIGKAHERVGLPPRWYLLAYNRYFDLFTPLIFQFYIAEPKKAEESLIALHKAFMLDASIAMDAYLASDRYRHLRQLESIVNDSADTIYMLDSQDRFRAWNLTAERVFGWKAAEIIGKPFTTIVPPEKIQDGEMDRITRALREQGRYHFETERLAKDGRRVPVDVSCSVLRDPQGNVIGRSSITRDITERHRLEQAKLQAERLAVIGTMAAKLAHEIRNPLSSVNMNIELVRYEIETLAKQNPSAGDEARTLLRSIESEVKRIQRVTQDYLKFARIPKPRRERVALGEVLGQRLMFMQSLFKAQNVELVTDFDASMPMIFADEEQIWQAVLNLVQNSIDAMTNGGKLTVSLTGDGTDTVLKVSDTGKGMREEEREKLFKPFFSTKQSGTGLGLPLSQQIVAEHGGAIVCESEPGKGTTFIIRLPQESVG